MMIPPQKEDKEVCLGQQNVLLVPFNTALKGFLKNVLSRSKVGLCPVKSSIPIYSVLAKELLFDTVRINLSKMYLIDKRQIAEE